MPLGMSAAPTRASFVHSHHALRQIPQKAPDAQGKGGKEFFLQMQHFSLDAVTRSGKDG